MLWISLQKSLENYTKKLTIQHFPDKPKPATPRTPTQQRTPTSTPTVSTSSSSRSTSKEEVDDNISQNSFGGGIKGKLQALFSKEQTISESTIANKFKQEREKEMEMLQNRFHYKVSLILHCEYLVFFYLFVNVGFMVNGNTSVSYIESFIAS